MADYCTVEELKSRTDAVSSVAYDVPFDEIIEAASRTIDRYMRREDNAYNAPATATTRYFDGNAEAEIFIDECVEVTKVEYLSAETTWTAWASTDYMTLGTDGTRNTLPICSLRCDPYGDYATFPGLTGGQNIRVTARWGYSDDVPPEVREACIADALYRFKRAQQAYEDQGGITELGVVIYLGGLCRDATAALDHLPKKVR